MTKPTVTCCATPDAYCSRIDTLVDLDGVHVVAVVRSGAEVTLTIETPRERQGCRRCGVVALSHGRRTRLLRDVPCAGSAVPEALLRDYVGLGLEMYQAWGMTETSPMPNGSRNQFDSWIG